MGSVVMLGSGQFYQLQESYHCDSIVEASA